MIASDHHMKRGIVQIMDTQLYLAHHLTGISGISSYIIGISSYIYGISSYDHLTCMVWYIIVLKKSVSFVHTWHIILHIVYRICKVITARWQPQCDRLNVTIWKTTTVTLKMITVTLKIITITLKMIRPRKKMLCLGLHSPSEEGRSVGNMFYFFKIFIF